MHELESHRHGLVVGGWVAHLHGGVHGVFGKDSLVAVGPVRGVVGLLYRWREIISVFLMMVLMIRDGTASHGEIDFNFENKDVKTC